MTYRDRIDALKARLEAMGSPARLDLPFIEGRPPTQAFSEFLTNKEQGDWAEVTFLENFNRTQTDLWAVKYGRSEDLVAARATALLRPLQSVDRRSRCEGAIRR